MPNCCFRDITSVCGLTLQSLIAITTNIENREFKRIANANLSVASENPRSGTTDDVECSFSVMRDMTLH